MNLKNGIYDRDEEDYLSDIVAPPPYGIELTTTANTYQRHSQMVINGIRRRSKILCRGR
jgi:hypothetical protein